LEVAVKHALEAGVQKLKLDLKEMPYISSAGLRVLLVAQKQMMKRQGMRLVNVGETVLDVFKMTGFADILTIE
jgi:anti-sigma B factor antagonist